MNQLADQGIGVITFRDLRHHVGVKVAVGALTDAVRDMNVEGKGLHVDAHLINIVTKPQPTTAIDGEEPPDIS